MEIDKVSNRAESFFNEIAEEYYLSSSGLKEESNLSDIYEKYKDLFSKELIDNLLSLKSGETFDRRQAQLLEFLFSLYQGYRTRKISDKLLSLEASSTITIASEKVPYRRATVLIKNSPDREKRKIIQEEVDKIVERDNPLRVESIESVHNVAAEFGYENYSSMISDTSGIDLDAFHVSCEKLLSSTEEMFVDVSSWAFKKYLNLDLEKAQTYDSLYLFRLNEYDEFFPADELLEKVRKCISSMNLDMEAGGNIKIDTENRPAKSPRAFCAPISVPDKIMLVIMPQGGLLDYQSFLHELGHAMHYAHVDPSMPMEHRYLGDNSVTEGFAMLFDHLTLNTKWLKRVAGMEDQHNYLIMSNLLDLYMLRRYSAKFIYERELHGGSSLSDMPDAYASMLTEATKIAYQPLNYLNDVDGEFYCARYLRAWMLQSLINMHLTEECGDDWFLNPESGDKLRELWKYGQKLNAEEICKLISVADMNFDNLTKSIEDVFNG